MTAEDFTNLHLQYLSTQAEGELPATIEHDFHNGRMVDHYFVTPSPNFWNDEAIRELEGVTGIMFLQQPDGSVIKTTEMLALNIYSAFYSGGGNNRGVGQAKAVVFFILVAVIGLIQLQSTRKKEVQQ